MKKAKFITIVTVVSFLSVIGCKKKEAETAITSGTTVKGQVKAELDLTISGKENVPDGTKITFLIDPNSLLNDPDTSKNYDSYRYTAIVSSGIYSINIPARNNGTQVKIIADDFEYQTVLDNNGNKSRTVYSASKGTITVYAGTTAFYDINY